MRPPYFILKTHGLITANKAFILTKVLYIYTRNLIKTRTKTSIRYAKENDNEKRERRRERKKCRRRDIERNVRPL